MPDCRIPLLKAGLLYNDNNYKIAFNIFLHLHNNDFKLLFGILFLILKTLPHSLQVFCWIIILLYYFSLAL